MKQIGKNSAPFIKIHQLSKVYAAKVLNNISFELKKGEVRGLVGENGAGKSTLSKIICGLTPASSGSMSIKGKPYQPLSKKDADEVGIHMVMQELNLVPTLSVAENLFLGDLPRRWGFIDFPVLHGQSRQLLEQVGLEGIDPGRPVGELGVGQQQMLEIAANLAGDCNLLILDEPTAMLTNREAELLFRQIQLLKAKGVSIIFISHRLEEVQRVSDSISILRDGELVATHDADQIKLDEIVNLMVGRRLEDSAFSGKREQGPVALKVDSLTRTPVVKGVGFELKQGEILGFAGLVGSGRTETLRLIFGADKKESGSIYIKGSAVSTSIRSPKDAVKNGIAMITEDRKEQGLLLTQSISVNTSLAKIEGVAGFGWINRKEEERLARDFGEKMSLKATSVKQPVDQLSGGNQQKVIIARWLYPECDILLFDEPTRGIDVGAKFDIYKILQGLAEKGKAIVMVSSDLRELMMICDNIAVMSSGKLVNTFSRDNWSKEKILTAAFSEYLTADKA